ncbi:MULTISPECIES: 4Fe-4S binding protein [Metallosphaera]|uniref:4Fe-4S ferredoxin, iron-sulfur binding domain protein n=3 Tax=Metallosphaera TaxID=41980 RepID=A4YG82_METS5|nr:MULTISPECIES: 4Fe-4S ferredoxin [Metallosphaera]ABP95434.1 4Fe-4S ferredoxin, iron-sulfur binding domain protein [Metallosphaera sedula DSM 5348]AIM27419.1 4Fe-4S ferredoxin, iron-sulfur binding domain protein [Metallosphaera sedula]AKV74293.1 4Fe-4S ferredoxin [Metallosphaera sedula]AKV76532.1 4Fe-4S ferredoxin [Metallosphaera sedula]AKV78784.1 4Fe-4S ferredoxin [Metallosphaera sedula]
MTIQILFDFSVIYIVIMMLIDFWIFGYVLRKEFVNLKAILFLISVTLIMSSESVSIAYIAVLHGSLFMEPVTLSVAFTPMLLSLLVKSERVSVRRSLRLSAILSIALLVDEVSMGYLYGSFAPQPNPILTAVDNPAFGLMMLGDGVYFMAISRTKSVVDWSLTTFALSMAFMPSLYRVAGVELVTSLMSSLIMIVNIVMLYIIEMRQTTLRGQLVSISLALFDFVMMLGLSFFAGFNDLYVITLAMLISMVWYFFLIFFNVPSSRIQMKLRYPFLFLVLVNLAELAMGFGESVLGFNLTNAIFSSSVMHHGTSMSHSGMAMRSPFTNPFWWLFPINPLTMTEMYLHKGFLISLFMTPFMLVMSTTMSPFYVIMMGAEMSFLVYQRYKRVKSRYLRNWTLAILVGVPIFVVLIPYYTNFYVFGMSGMIFPVTLATFALSLGVIVVASILFGRGSYCNLVCMSAHMFSNIFYEQFQAKTSSKIWEYARRILMIPMFLFLGLYVMQELHGVNFPLDPLNFYGMFTLNYVWWFFYFLTPIFGTYSCARQGWCGFGTFTGIFNKVLFKIRAKNLETCRTCSTKNCDSSCPVKIPVSQDIIRQGYTNRVSCVGCARCVEVCPHENLEVRNILSLLK